MERKNMLSISNTLIFLSILATIVLSTWNEVGIYGMNHYFLSQWYYLNLCLQFVLYSFFHGGILHLLFNSVFIYYFGNQVEGLIGKVWYMVFFVFITIMNWVSLLYFTHIPTNTIGISGFALAILTFITLVLYRQRNPDYKWWITAIIINIGIWLSPGISLVWHLFWAIFWWCFYLIYNFIQKIRGN